MGCTLTGAHGGLPSPSPTITASPAPAPVAAVMPAATPQPATTVSAGGALAAPTTIPASTDAALNALTGSIDALTQSITTLTNTLAAQAQASQAAAAQAQAGAQSVVPAQAASMSAVAGANGGALFSTTPPWDLGMSLYPPADQQALAGANAAPLGGQTPVQTAQGAAALSKKDRRAARRAAKAAALDGPSGGLSRAERRAAKAGGSASQSPVQITAREGTKKGNAQIVAQVAQEMGVDPVLAVAMMLTESGGNERAVGDNGTSFGLFQLHEGGMLTSAKMTPQEAFDPRANAEVSLRSLKAYSKKDKYSSPGALAAASQRPADPSGYADKVNGLMNDARKLLGG